MHDGGPWNVVARIESEHGLLGGLTQFHALEHRPRLGRPATKEDFGGLNDLALVKRVHRVFGGPESGKSGGAQGRRERKAQTWVKANRSH